MITLLANLSTKLYFQPFRCIPPNRTLLALTLQIEIWKYNIQDANKNFERRWTNIPEGRVNRLKVDYLGGLSKQRPALVLQRCEKLLGTEIGIIIIDHRCNSWPMEVPPLPLLTSSPLPQMPCCEVGLWPYSSRRGWSLKGAYWLHCFIPSKKTQYRLCGSGSGTWLWVHLCVGLPVF